MSGRFCSVACGVLFARDPAPREELLYPAECDLGAVIGQKCLQLGQGDVGRRLVSLRINSACTLILIASISVLLLWRRRYVLA
jgi:hypothetical protein